MVTLDSINTCIIWKDFLYFHLKENILQIYVYLTHFTNYLVAIGCDLQQSLEYAVLLVQWPRKSIYV